jgi:hypothetical protein
MHNVHVQFLCTYTLILLLVLSSLPAGGLKRRGWSSFSVQRYRSTTATPAELKTRGNPDAHSLRKERMRQYARESRTIVSAERERCAVCERKCVL